VRQIVRDSGANYLADRYVCGFDGKPQGESPVGFILDGQQRVRAIFEGFASVAEREPGKPREHGLRRIWFLNLDLFISESSGALGALDRSVTFERSISFRKLEPGVAHSKYLEQCLQAGMPSSREPQFVFPLGLLVSKKNDKQRASLKGILARFAEARGSFGRAAISRLLKDLENVAKYKVTILERDKCDAIEASSVYERINATGKDLETWHIASAHLFARSQPCRDLLAKIETRFSQDQGEFIDGQAGLVGIGQHDLLLASIHAGADSGEHARPLNTEAILAVSRSETGLNSLRAGLERIDAVASEVAILLEENGVRRREHWPAPVVSVALLAAIARSECPKDVLSTGSIRKSLQRWWWERSMGAGSTAATNTALPKLFEEATQVCEGHSFRKLVSSWSLGAFGIDPSVVRSGSKAKALCALLRVRGLCDFRSWNARGHRQALDLHHVFPMKWLRERRRGDGNCFANLTLIRKDTNRDYIRAKRPSEYIAKIISDNRNSRDPRVVLAGVLGAHGIEIGHLEAEDFDSFLAHRLKWFEEIFAQLDADLAV
jgi:hypothetical protein